MQHDTRNICRDFFKFRGANRWALVALVFLPQYSIIFCSRAEADDNILSAVFIGPIVPDKAVKCSDPHLNRSRGIRPKAVRYGI